MDQIESSDASCGKRAALLPVAGISNEPNFEIILTVKVTPLRRGSAALPGALHVRRQQVDSNLGDVIEKALNRKLPKLVNTTAHKRILLLERQHMNPVPGKMMDEIEKRRSAFPALSTVDEIWIVDTIFYGTPFGGTYLRFVHYCGSQMIGTLEFNDAKLLTRSGGGMAEVVSEVS